jgi:hypothetical protein
MMTDLCSKCKNNRYHGLKWYKPFCDAGNGRIEADVLICDKFKELNAGDGRTEARGSDGHFVETKESTQ